MCICNTLGNNFDLGDVPNELKDLTPMEMRMISIYNSLTTIYKIKNGSEVSIGSVCHVVNDVASYVKILPRKPDHCGIFYVRTRSKIRSTSSNLNVSVHKINAFKIRNSLSFNNIMSFINVLKFKIASI
jgi:hypothetical protein